MPTKPCCDSRLRHASSSSSRNLSQASSLSDRTPQAIDAIAHGSATVSKASKQAWKMGMADAMRFMYCDYSGRRV